MYKSSKDGDLVMFFFFISIFILNILYIVSEGIIEENLVKVENFICLLVFIVYVGQEWLSFNNLGRFEEIQFFFFENNFLV